MKRERELDEVVYTGPVSSLVKASELLASEGIACRFTRPARVDGLLRVGRADGVRARSLLHAVARKRGRVMEASEAARFRCPKCEAMLSLGAKHCTVCGAYVPD